MPEINDAGTIGGLEIANRAVFPAILMNYASDRGEVTERLIEHYRQLARGGYGLIISECTFPQFKGGIATRGLALYDDRFIPGLKRLANAVKQHGSLLGVQIFFDGAGRVFASDETVSIGPSNLSPWNGPFMRPMTEDDISVMVDDFATASGRAVACGADLIELHMGHAHLLGRFLSPYWNRREDQFGGDFQGRMRFPLLVLEAVRRAVGNRTPITARLCLSEMLEGGIDLPLAIEIGRALKAAGIDAIHTSAGTGTTPKGLASIFPTCFSEEAPFSSWARQFRKETGLTTIFAGKVSLPETAARLLEDGTADFVSIGRGGLADPAWPNKAIAGISPRPCIGCNQGCTDSLITRKEIICTVNPQLGFDREFASVAKLPDKPRIAVVGGGVAGINCAIGLADRGAQVVLFEENNRLGGNYHYSAIVPGKEQYARYTDYLIRSLNESSVEVRTGTRLAPEDPALDDFRTVFWAGGARTREWNGGTLACEVIRGEDCFEAPALQGASKSIAVIGAGQIGCDAALWLSGMGHKIALIDSNAEPLLSFAARRYDYEKTLEKYNVMMRFGLTATASPDANLALHQTDGKPVDMISPDIVVAATGRTPRIMDLFTDSTIRIGDAARPGTALDAIRQGVFHAAFYG
jgi:2,4-dienoyl-CoA reductase-like NADH-dependent reductase (Old Yellow Enzyme family)